MKDYRFKSFSSGSCGNCYYLGIFSEEGECECGVLIDAGGSPRRLKKELAAEGLDYTCFDDILITHDHLDHIRSLGSYCKHLQKRVWTTDVLAARLKRHFVTGEYFAPVSHVLDESWTEIVPDRIKVRYFIVPHDATQTVGYAIEVEDHKFVIMTDIGRMTDEAVEFARQADTVVVESNYDMDMLMAGPYTYELKMRIVQGCGHLSNDECASAIKRFWHPGLRNIFLCHLSENNNTHDLAYRCSAAALQEIGVQKGTLSLRCLPRQYPSQMFNL